MKHLYALIVCFGSAAAISGSATVARPQDAAASQPNPPAPTPGAQPLDEIGSYAYDSLPSINKIELLFRIRKPDGTVCAFHPPSTGVEICSTDLVEHTYQVPDGPVSQPAAEVTRWKAKVENLPAWSEDFRARGTGIRLNLGDIPVADGEVALEWGKAYTITCDGGNSSVEFVTPGAPGLEKISRVEIFFAEPSEQNKHTAFITITGTVHGTEPNTAANLTNCFVVYDVGQGETVDGTVRAIKRALIAADGSFAITDTRLGGQLAVLHGTQTRKLYLPDVKDKMLDLKLDPADDKDKIAYTFHIDPASMRGPLPQDICIYRDDSERIPLTQAFPSKEKPDFTMVLAPGTYVAKLLEIQPENVLHESLIAKSLQLTQEQPNVSLVIPPLAATTPAAGGP